jgi:hypothetical protein
LQHRQSFLWNIARPFGHPLIVHCSVSGTVVTRFASSISFIRSDEADGLDVAGSTSIASLRDDIFACEDVGGGDGFCEEAFKVLGVRRDQLYSDLPSGESRDRHVSGAIIAYAASRVV